MKIDREVDSKSIKVGRAGHVEAPKSIEVGRSGSVEAPKSIEVGRSGSIEAHQVARAGTRVSQNRRILGLVG